jgi:hypothetical protein
MFNPFQPRCRASLQRHLEGVASYQPSRRSCVLPWPIQIACHHKIIAHKRFKTLIDLRLDLSSNTQDSQWDCLRTKGQNRTRYSQVKKANGGNGFRSGLPRHAGQPERNLRKDHYQEHGRPTKSCTPNKRLPTSNDAYDGRPGQYQHGGSLVSCRVDRRHTTHHRDDQHLAPKENAGNSMIASLTGSHALTKLKKAFTPILASPGSLMHYFLVSSSLIFGMMSPGCLCCAYFQAPSEEAVTNHLATSGERTMVLTPASVNFFMKRFLWSIS